ncbi:MAG: hypothetical protein ACP5L4_06570, partial [Thermoplasmata archaeon]
MKVKTWLFIALDVFLSFLIIVIAVKLGLSFLSIQIYKYGLIIIDIAVTTAVLVLMNKAFVKHIKKSKDSEKPQENEGKELQEKSEKQAEIKQPNIKKEEEKEEEEKKEIVKHRRHIPKKIRIAITGSIIFIGIIAFLEIMFHISSFKGNSVFIP